MHKIGLGNHVTFLELSLFFFCSKYRQQFYTVTTININFYRVMRCHAMSVRLSVCPSVTFVDHVKTNKHIFEFFFTIGRDTILVSLCQRGCRYSDGNPPNGGVEYKGV